MKNKIKQNPSSDSSKSDNPKVKKSHKAVIIRGVLMLIILCAIFIYYIYSDNSSYKGEVESTIVSNIAEVSGKIIESDITPVSYTHLRAHETRHDLVCRLLLEKKKKNKTI